MEGKTEGKTAEASHWCFFKKTILSYFLTSPASPLWVPSQLIKNGKCQSGAGGTLLPGKKKNLSALAKPTAPDEQEVWRSCWVFNYLLCRDYEERPP